jgi:hypothetical protein
VGSTFGIYTQSYDEYAATRQTSVLLCYNIDSNNHGIIYSVFEDGSLFSNVYTTNTVLNAYSINSNATAVLQIDSSNNLNIDICSQGIGTSTLVLSSITAYRANLEQYAQFDFYTNFFSFNLPLADGVSYEFITVQSDTATITASSTITRYTEAVYSGSTGIILYNNDTATIIQNGILGKLLASITSIGVSGAGNPDFALGYAYAISQSDALLYQISPNGLLTSTPTNIVDDIATNQTINITDQAILITNNNPFSLQVQTLDTSNYYYSISENLSSFNSYYQSNSFISAIAYGSIPPFIESYIIFDYITRTFNVVGGAFTDQNTQPAITTSPYLFHRFTS